MKLITIAALVGLLAACNVGATTPSVQPISMPPSSTAGVATPSPSTAVGMSCTDSFAQLDVSAISSTTDMMSLSDQLDTTISACQTVDEWTSAVQTVLPQVDTTQAQAFIQERCTTNTTLATTPLCTEVGS
jgi:hypothetical protein